MVELGAFSDKAAFSDWLRELEVVRRLSRFYPANHPALEPALERFAEAEAFLGRDQTVLEVRRDAFFLRAEALTSVRHPARQLAQQLLRAGVVGVVVEPPFATEERTEAVQMLAGLQKHLRGEERRRFLEQSRSLQSLKLIPFSEVFAVEPGAAKAKHLLALPGSGVHDLVSIAGVTFGERVGAGELRAAAEAIDRARDPFGLLTELVDHLAQLLHRHEDEGAILRGLALLAAVREMAQAINPGNRMLLARLLIQRGDGGDLCSRMPEALVVTELLDAVEAMVAAGVQVPAGSQRIISALAAPPEVQSEPLVSLTPEVRERARRLVSRMGSNRAFDVTKPVVDAEESTRSLPFTAQLGSWTCATRALGAGEEVSASLGAGPIRRQAAQVLRQVHALVPFSELGRVAARELVVRYLEHLELGEFAAAIEVAQDLLRQGREEEIERLVDRGGLEALLQALSRWGKQRRAEVMMVVALLGERIVPSVLHRLTTEDDLAVRKRLLEMVVIIGPAAAPGLRSLLSHARWYVVRNAVHLLREVAPRDHTDAVARLTSHAERRVASEAVAYLLDAHDQRGLDGLRALLARDDDAAFQDALSLAARRRRHEVGVMLAAELQSRLAESVGMDRLPEVARAVAIHSSEEATSALLQLASQTGRRHRAQLTAARLAVLEGLSGRGDRAALRVVESLTDQKDDVGARARELRNRWRRR